MVFQEIRIEDKFKFEAQQGDAGPEMYYGGAASSDGQNNAMYWNTYALALMIVAFVLVQLFVIFVCWMCTAHRSRGDPVSWDGGSYYK